MKTINNSSKRKSSSLKKIIIFIILFIITISTYILTTNKNSSKGFSSALYTGKSKTSGNSQQPSKLRWTDSFKGINNMGK